jgi:hypothetical protein
MTASAVPTATDKERLICILLLKNLTKLATAPMTWCLTANTRPERITVVTCNVAEIPMFLRELTSGEDGSPSYNQAHGHAGSRSPVDAAGA